MRFFNRYDKLRWLVRRIFARQVCFGPFTPALVNFARDDIGNEHIVDGMIELSKFEDHVLPCHQCIDERVDD